MNIKITVTVMNGRNNSKRQGNKKPVLGESWTGLDSKACCLESVAKKETQY